MTALYACDLSDNGLVNPRPVQDDYTGADALVFVLPANLVPVALHAAGNVESHVEPGDPATIAFAGLLPRTLADIQTALASYAATTITCDAADLRRAIKQCQRAINKKTTLPILSHVRIVACGDSIAVTATDLQTAVTVDVPARMTGLTRTCVLPEALARALPPKGDLDIQAIADGLDGITVNGIPIGGLPDDEFPFVPPVDGPTATVNVAELSAAWETVKRAVSKDPTRARLTGVLLEAHNGLLNIVATDTHRMAVDALPWNGPDLMAIIPAGSMAILCATMDAHKGGLVEVTWQNHAHLCEAERVEFRGAGYTVTARTVDGCFPNWRKCLPDTKFMDLVNINGAAFTAALKRLDLKERELVEFGLRPGTVTVRHQTKGQPSATLIDLDCQTDIPALRAAFNGRFVLDALASLGADVYGWYVLAADQPCVFIGQHGQSITLMPMQLV